MSEFNPENGQLEWGPNRFMFDRRPGQQDMDSGDVWVAENFRRVEVPEGINMSCFEQTDSMGRVLGRVWVTQSNETDPLVQD